ncbi:unnamed protein product, partial [Prorocentrum cordatum]
MFEDFVAPNHHQVMMAWGKTAKQLRLKPLTWKSKAGSITVYPMKKNDDTSWMRLRMFSEMTNCASTNRLSETDGVMKDQHTRVLDGLLKDDGNEKAQYSTFRLPSLACINERSAQLGGKVLALQPDGSGSGRFSTTKPAAPMKKTPSDPNLQKGTPEYWFAQISLSDLMCGGKPGQGPYQLEMLLTKVAEGKRPQIRKYMDLIQRAKDIAKIEALDIETLDEHMEKLIAANTEVPVSVQFNILKKKADVLWNKWVVDISNEEPLISYLQMFRPWDQQ